MNTYDIDLSIDNFVYLAELLHISRIYGIDNLYKDLSEDEKRNKSEIAHQSLLGKDYLRNTESGLEIDSVIAAMVYCIGNSEYSLVVSDSNSKNQYYFLDELIVGVQISCDQQIRMSLFRDRRSYKISLSDRLNLIPTETLPLRDEYYLDKEIFQHLIGIEDCKQRKEVMKLVDDPSVSNKERMFYEENRTFGALVTILLRNHINPLLSEEFGILKSNEGTYLLKNVKDDLSLEKIFAQVKKPDEILNEIYYLLPT